MSDFFSGSDCCSKVVAPHLGALKEVMCSCVVDVDPKDDEFAEIAFALLDVANGGPEAGKEAINKIASYIKSRRSALKAANERTVKLMKGVGDWMYWAAANTVSKTEAVAMAGKAVIESRAATMDGKGEKR